MEMGVKNRTPQREAKLNPRNTIMNHPTNLKCLLLLLALLGSTPTMQAQTTAFTYQGRLNTDAGEATGLYDFIFDLHATATGGIPAATANSTNGVPVTNGLFTVTLNFGGSAFTGANRWLAIAVRTNGVGGFATLTPRQFLSSAPYAIYAGTAASATGVAAGGVGNAALAVGAVDSSRILDGSIAASDLSFVVASNTFWRLTGNAGTTAGVNFLGTTDNQPVEVKVNNVRALRLEPASSPNLIGGFNGNSVSGGVGATIGGGGAAGFPNRVNANYGVVAGGLGNSVLQNDSFIGGGIGNNISTDRAAISGGRDNSIRTNAANAAIGGGWNNIVTGPQGTIPGGSFNTATNNAFAAGTRAKAIHPGSFVWADSQNLDQASSANNQFLVRAIGGISLSGNVSVNAPSTLSFGASTRQMLNLWTAEYGIGVQSSTLYQRTGGEFAWHRFGTHSDGYADPGAGGTNLMRLDGAGSLFLASSVVVDATSSNPGSHYPGLVFGGSSGETISSKRTAGGNKHGLDFYTGFVPRLSIANNGGIGIGTQAPEAALLDVEGDVRLNEFDLFLRSGSDNGHGLGYRSTASGRETDGPFLYGFNGGALGVSGPDSISLSWDYNGNVWVSNNINVATITIRGGSDVAEPFPMKAADVEPGSVVVIDENDPGHLKMSTEAYDTRVAGIVSGAGGVKPGLTLQQEGLLDQGHQVALTGRVYVKADATTAPIKPGDLLTTSGRAGFAMKVTDPARGTGAILGKAMTALKDGTGLVLVLVSLQ